jgi:hypothetical protein
MLKPSDLTPASYNPRIFSEEANSALIKSMETFNDISGITYNENTGNIVGGHHRWDNLILEYGIDSLKFKDIKNTDRMLISTLDGVFTGFLLRIVDWSIDKEKAANITANSHAVEGEFTSGLQEVLKSVREGFNSDSLFNDLRLNTLETVLKPVLIKKDNDRPVKKSSTMISGGGDKYITVKLELSLALSDRLNNLLDRFKDGTNSVEQPLDTMLKYIENSSDEQVIGSNNTPVKRRARKRRD